MVRIHGVPSNKSTPKYLHRLTDKNVVSYAAGILNHDGSSVNPRLSTEP